MWIWCVAGRGGSEKDEMDWNEVDQEVFAC